MNLRPLIVVAGLLVAVGTASAVDLKGLKKSFGEGSSTGQDSESLSSLRSLGDSLGELSLPAISGNTAGNAAGVLEYCVKRKYLSGNAVASVKDKLLSKYGLGDAKAAEQDSGYQNGLQGILQGDGGKSFDLDSVSDKLKDKGCDYVLDNAGKLV